MALPDSISGINFAPNGGRQGAFESGGSYYFLAIDSTNTAVLEVWKSTDAGTAAWSNVASLGSGSTLAIKSIDAVQVGSIIHVLETEDNSPTTINYRYNQFNCGTDSFDVSNETAIQLTADLPASGDIYGALAVRSDGSVVAVIQDAQPKVMGTPRPRVSYLKRSTGGTWDSTTTAVDDGGAVDYKLPRCVLGASNKVHITYYDGTDIQHKSLNSSDSLSSAEAVNDTAISTITPFSGGLLAYHNDGTNDLVMVIWRKQLSPYLYSSLITNDGTPAAEADVSATATSAGRFNICSVNNSDTTSRFYAIWVDATDADIDHSEYDGIWNTPVSTESSISANAIAGVNVYTNDSSATVLAYLYIEGTAGDSYNEYELAAGGTYNDVITTLGNNATITEAHEEVLQLITTLVASGSITSTVELLLNKTLSLASSGSLTATAQQIKDYILSINGSSTLSDTPQQVIDTTATLAGSSTVSSIIELILEKILSIGASGTIASTEQLIQDVTTSLSQTATLLETHEILTDILTSLSGNASLTETGEQVQDVLASIDVSATITSTPDLGETYADRVDTLVTSASLTLSNELVQDVSTALAAAISLTETSELIKNLTLQIDGNASLVETAELIKNLALQIDAGATLTEVAQQVQDIASAVDALASLADTPEQVQDGSNQVDARATLTETNEHIKEIVTSLLGSATITSTPDLGDSFLDRTDLVNAGITLTVANELLQDVSTLLNSSIALTEVGEFIREVTTSVLVSATMTVNQELIFNRQLSMAAGLDLITVEQLVQSGVVSFNVDTSLSEQAQLLQDTSVALMGSLTLSELNELLKDGIIVLSADVSITAPPQTETPAQLYVVSAPRQDGQGQELRGYIVSGNPRQDGQTGVDNSENINKGRRL